MDRKTEAQLRQELSDVWDMLRASDAALLMLRKDAERYRWLRDSCPDLAMLQGDWEFDTLDPRIDAALASKAVGAA